MAMAWVVPTMLPVPTVADRAVVTACMGVTAPAPASCFWNILPTVFFMAWPKCRNWTPPLRMVRNSPPRMAQGRKVYIQAKSFSGPEMKPKILLMISINSLLNLKRRDNGNTLPQPRPYCQSCFFTKCPQPGDEYSLHADKNVRPGGTIE
jgi:hypothetical protein